MASMISETELPNDPPDAVFAVASFPGGAHLVYDRLGHAYADAPQHAIGFWPDGPVLCLVTGPTEPTIRHLAGGGTEPEVIHRPDSNELKGLLVQTGADSRRSLPD
ncbi:hypothetical protein [Streptomyces sp. NPDC057002]|uniref:hypothetical protein n=1 Tax=Streptomyces sp. NPDC057002 TaxID=3345992 RepID=UPI00362C30D0